MREPDRIVGELLQPGGVNALQKLGLSKCLDNMDGIDTLGYVVIKSKDEQVLLKYPKKEGEDLIVEKMQESDSDDTKSEGSVDPGNGRFWGRSFHHGRFIMNLRKAAQEEKLVTIVEATANSLITGKDDSIVGVACTVKGEPEETASQTVGSF
jgi:squalene monooxygenase